jgi:hypothetical protein
MLDRPRITGTALSDQGVTGMSDFDDVLLTRNECRELGVKVSNTTFQRYEKQGRLTPRKACGARSARVRYWRSEVLALLGTRPPTTPQAAALRA